MLAVLGVPQLLSSFFDIRERRKERQEAERRREEEARRHEEEAKRREDRHHEVMTLLATLVSNTSGHNGDRDAVIRAQQQIINRLASENDQLRQENGSGSQ